jgi:hypothetical protein
MGAFGPKMVKMQPTGLATPPPYTYVDNPNCLLDTGDLVFIDAMGTGFSRPDKPGYGPDFGGVENDLAAFGEFIRSFLNEYNLWGSPLFVGGESYGTTRAAGLAGYLTDRDIPINGVMLLSAVIDSNAAAGEQRQLSTLPTEIMTAHFHKKLAPDLQKLTVEQIAKQAREFASGEYLEYLFDGARATQAQRDKVLANMARYTGLSKTFIDSLDLRVPLGPFSTELLRDRHLMTSRLDSRFAGYQLDAGANNTSFDYSNSNIENCFLTAFEAYVRNELNYKNDNLYYVSGNAPPWSGEYNTVVNLENGFAKNPHMHLFVGFGYYDFPCPNEINVGLYPRDGRVPTGVTTRADAHVTNGAGYAQEGLSLLHGRLLLGGGVRYDEFRFGVVDKVNPEQDGVQTAGRWQGKGNVAFTPSKSVPLTLHLNYGRGINSIDARGVVQMPDQPRLATTDFYQFGTSSNFGRLSIATDAFLIDHSNEQVYIPDDGSFEFKGPSRAYGYEAKASLAISHHFSLNGGMTVFHVIRFHTPGAFGGLAREV